MNLAEMNMEKGGPKVPMLIYLVNWLIAVDKPFTRDLEMIGKLNSFHEALSTLNWGKLHLLRRQCHGGNGHLGLEMDMNCWPSNHLEQA